MSRIAGSFPGSGQGWINSQRVIAPNASNVQPDQNAWFIFPVKVPTNATVSDYKQIYFRPYHTTGGYISNWGGMCFNIHVIDPPSESFPSKSTLTPVAGDWNGDGLCEVGVYVQEENNFYLDQDNNGYTDLTIGMGASGDQPIVGDWDGEWYIYHRSISPSTRRFYLDYDNDRVADLELNYGDPGDTPVVGDWDGNGSATIGIYRPSTRTFWLDYNNDGSADLGRTFGDPGDTPVVGDWDGDGDWTIGLYRASARTFYLDYVKRWRR